MAAGGSDDGGNGGELFDHDPDVTTAAGVNLVCRGRSASQSRPESFLTEDLAPGRARAHLFLTEPRRSPAAAGLPRPEAGSGAPEGLS